MKFITDKYEFRARFLPAVLCSIPFVALNYYILSRFIGDFFGQLLAGKIAGVVAVPLAFIFALMLASRTVGVEVFEARIFKSGSHFPSTDLLLWSNSHYSEDFKKMVRDKMTSRFKVRLSTPGEEKRNESLARQRLSEGVSLMRGATRGNPLLLQHNWEYGAVRNFIGGSLIAAAFSALMLVTLVFGSGRAVPVVYLVLTIAYAIPVAFSRTILERAGKAYAKVLIEQFLQLK